MLPDSIIKLKNELLSLQQPSIAEMEPIVGGIEVTLEDISGYAQYGHSPSDSYGRQLLISESNLEIYVMSWMPGDYSAIHDHGNLLIAGVKTFHALDHSVYSLKDSYLALSSGRMTSPGEWIIVDGKTIHQMGNNEDSKKLSLHVYLYDENDGDTDSRVFNVTQGKVEFTNGGAFYCLHDSKIESEKSGLRADPQTLISEEEKYQFRKGQQDVK